jgi:hypothetical protein
MIHPNFKATSQTPLPQLPSVVRMVSPSRRWCLAGDWMIVQSVMPGFTVNRTIVSQHLQLACLARESKSLRKILIINKICHPLLKSVIKIARVAKLPVFPCWRLEWRTKPVNYTFETRESRAY